MLDSLLCGLRTASDIPLPELLAWRGDGRAPDLEIRLGKVPDQLATPVHDGPLLQIAADGRCRFAMPGIASYLAEDGRRITVQPEPAADPTDVRLFLLGTMFGFVCHQRALLPLHAGCVEIGGRAVAFTGPSGAGKSTLAAGFLRRGYRLLADDLTVIDIDGAEGPTVLPSFPRVKLWRDSLEGLGWSDAGRTRVRSAIDKFELPVETAFLSTPLPLGAVYHLVRARTPDRAGITLLRGADALVALLSGVYRQRRAIQMGHQDLMTRATMRMAAIPNLRLSRMMDLAQVDAVVDAIVARHAPRD